MKHQWKLFVCFLFTVLIMMLGPVHRHTAYAEDWVCGSNVNAHYNTHYLTLSLKDPTITGHYNNVSYCSLESYPWHSYRNVIEHIQIDDGVINIPADAFADLPNLESVILPNSVVIQENAFKGSRVPDEVYFYGTKTEWQNMLTREYGIDSEGNEAVLQAKLLCMYMEDITIDVSAGRYNFFGREGVTYEESAMETMAFIYTFHAADKQDNLLKTVFEDVKRRGYDLNNDGWEDITLFGDFDDPENLIAFIEKSSTSSITGSKTIKLKSETEQMLRDARTNHFIGTITVIFTKKIADAAVAAIEDQVYTGEPIKPNPVLTLDGKTLREGTDYEVTGYKNNTEVGTATIELTGKGAFEGKKEVQFRIIQKEPETETATESVVPAVTGVITPEAPAVLTVISGRITNSKNEKDQSGSTYALLQAKGEPGSNTSVRLRWKKVPGSKKYIVYGNQCGKNKKYKKIKTVKGTSFTQKKLKSGKYYKYIVVAVNGDKALAVSKTIHVVTAGGRAGNHTKVVYSKKTLSLRKGKSKTVKATMKSGKGKVNVHRNLAFESDDVSVATVNKKGKITAVASGTCYIYAYAQNGVFAKLKVTVR